MTTSLEENHYITLYRGEERSPLGVHIDCISYDLSHFTAADILLMM